MFSREKKGIFQNISLNFLKIIISFVDGIDQLIVKPSNLKQQKIILQQLFWKKCLLSLIESRGFFDFHLNF